MPGQVLPNLNTFPIPTAAWGGRLLAREPWGRCSSTPSPWTHRGRECWKKALISSPLPRGCFYKTSYVFFPQHILRHRLERQIATGDPLPSNAVQLPQPHQERVLTSFSPTSTLVLQQQHRRQRTPSASSSSRRKLPSPAPEATSSHQGPGREGSSSRSHPTARFLQPSWSSLQPGQVQQQ